MWIFPTLEMDGGELNQNQAITNSIEGTWIIQWGSTFNTYNKAFCHWYCPTTWYNLCIMKSLVAKTLLTYLRLLAKLQLKKNKKAKLIGVTGSSGKSTTHTAIYAVLKDYFQVKKSQKANSESGIPLDILGLHPESYTKLEWLKLALMAPIKLLTNWKRFDIYLVEMGIDGPDEPKNMRYLLKILQPDIGVFTGVTTSHSEPWDKLIFTNNLDHASRVDKLKKLIATEKGLMLRRLPGDGWAIYNADDPFVVEAVKPSKAHQLKVGTHDQADIKIIKATTGQKSLTIKLKHQDNEASFIIHQPFLAEKLAIDFALAVGVGVALGLSLKQAGQSLSKNFKPLSGRGRILKGIRQSTIIDASYNAQPDAVLANLALLKQLKTNGRKLVVLGDMRELGQSSRYWHEKIADEAAKIADEIVLVGPMMKEFFLPQAIKRGFDKNKIHHFGNTYQASLFVKKQVKPSDLILVQASQNTLLFEIIVKEILSDEEDPDEVLARWRSTYFKRERKKIIDEN